MSFDPPASGSFPQAPPAPSLIGEVLDGRYKVFKKLGEGGMGEVFAAEHVHIEKRFAVKLLKAEIVSNPEAVKRFQQEARSSSSIKHRNIIGVEDFGRLADGRIYMCMELLDGAPLNEMIAHPMGADRLLNILIQSGHGLAAAHAKGIVHRDMKPENIFVTHEGNPPNDVPKLLDFGIAKVAGNEGQNNLTRTGTIFGTPFYMAPEQALGNPVDARTDIYAMGVIMYECFAGSLPFQGESFMGILTQHITTPPEPVAQRAAKAGRALPMGVAEIITRCMDKDPAARFQTMDDLVNALIPVYRSIAGAGMSTYMEAFPVGSAQHTAQHTPGPMVRGGATNQSATVAAHTPPPFAMGSAAPHQSQPMAPMHAPTGQGAALGQSGMYDPSSSSMVAPKKSKTGLIVALIILLAAGGGIAAVVVLGGKKKTDGAAGGTGGSDGSAEVVADKGSGGSAGGVLPDKGSAAVPDKGSAVVPDKGSDAVPDKGSADTGSGSADVKTGSDGSAGTTPPDNEGTGSNAGSNNTVDTAPKTAQVLILTNVNKFDTFEGVKKLGSGPNNITVTLGTPRTLTLKAKGYESMTITVDGSQGTVTTMLRSWGGTTTVNTGNTGNTGTPPPKKDCSKALLDPSSETCRQQYCKTHASEVSCMAE